MRTKHHIIYIPGLGDGGPNLFAQKVAVRLWRPVHGVSVQLIRIGWADKHESFDNKLQRVIRAVDTAQERGYTVSIVAASAGASMAVNAFAKRPDSIHRVVTIVGAHGPVGHANKATLDANPALKVSLERQPHAIQSLGVAKRGQVLSVKPQADNIIRLEDMNIPDINYLHLSTRGHLITIAAALTLHSAKIISFIKR